MGPEQETLVVLSQQPCLLVVLPSPVPQGNLGPQVSIPAPEPQREPGKGPGGGKEPSFSVQMGTNILFCIFLTGNVEA